MQSAYNYFAFNKLYAVLLAAADFLLAIQLIKLTTVYAGNRVAEAMGARGRNKSLYQKCSVLVNQYIKKYGNREKKKGIVYNAAIKMRRSGYTGEYAPVVYLALKFLVVPILFIAGLVSNYPDVISAFAVPIGIYLVIEAVVASNRRKISLKLQKYMYKIYKYLNNQISSGVRVSDAIGTVYEVIDDRKLRSILIRLAALYELTLDIDRALEEFRLNFNAQEAETLCVVLKQGLETGDNQELLARQEEIMFKKYFNYIQAETDSCKTRSLLSALMYTAVVVLMIIIPLINDTADAISSIFTN